MDSIFDDAEELEDKREYPLTPSQAFQLNADQQAAFDYLVPFCLGEGTTTKALLEGFAGTGKTFTINRVVEAVKASNPGISFGMTAPTHKAVRQLYKHSELKTGLDFATIHAFLGLKQVMKPDPKDKRKMIEVFEPDKSGDFAPRINDINILIVDEASMLSDELYGYIDDAVRSSRVRVIFMGDPLQIPPVGNSQDRSKNKDAIPFVPAQQQSRKIHPLKLVEIVRQAKDNPIIAYSLAIREQYLRQNIVATYDYDETSGVEVIERKLPAVRELIRKYFCTRNFRRDPDYIKIVAWRNDTVDYFNKEVRLLMNGVDSLPKIIVGDKLVLDKPFTIGKRTLATSEELEVLSAAVTSYPHKYHIIDRGTAFDKTMQETDGFDLDEAQKKSFEEMFIIYHCEVKAMDGKTYNVRILHEDSQQAYDDIQKRIADAAKKCTDFDRLEMWKQFYNMQKKFAWTKYNYCLTGHKSQGSTYDYCISMEWDIDVARQIVGFEESNRIRYVAATRARNKLFIVK